MSTTPKLRPSSKTSWPSSRSLPANRYSSDRLLALRVVMFAAAVPFLMRLPLSRLAWLITPPRNAHPEPSVPEAQLLVLAIDGWLGRSRPFVRPGCVTRGMTLYRFLRRAGAPVSLRFGVGLVNGRIEGHCWIVHRGEPLCERRDPRDVFTETWAIPS